MFSYHTVTSIARRRISWDPHGKMRLCGMVYWWCKIKGLPSLLPNDPSPSISPWTKSSLVLSKAKTKASFQSFCSIFKNSPVQHPASLACVSSCSPLLGCCLHVEAAQPHGCEERTCECTGQTWISKGDRALSLWSLQVAAKWSQSPSR